MRWIDTHIHVSDVGPDGRRREHFLRDLLDVLDRSGDELRLIVSCDNPYIAAMTRDPEQVAAGNRMIHELVRQAPGRLYGSCMVNPLFLRESLQIMDQCFGEWGFVQLGEMLPYDTGCWMDTAEGEAVVRKAVEYDVPVQVHQGTYWVASNHPSSHGMAHFADLLGIYRRVPEAHYVLGHFIGCGPSKQYVSWANMFLDALAGVFDAYPRTFWVEVRDFYCPALKRTLAEIPSDRILAGTDWTTRIGPPFTPYGTVFEADATNNPYPPSTESLKGFLLKAGATDEQIDRIAHRNAEELYRL